MNVTRRNFLKTTAAAAAVLPTMGANAFGKVSANDKLNVALIGCRNMGWGNLSDMLLTNEVECVALCDIDQSVLNNRTADLEKRGMKKPDLYGDYRNARPLALPANGRRLCGRQGCLCRKTDSQQSCRV